MFAFSSYLLTNTSLFSKLFHSYEEPPLRWFSLCKRNSLNLSKIQNTLAKYQNVLFEKIKTIWNVKRSTSLLMLSLVYISDWLIIQQWLRKWRMGKFHLCKSRTLFHTMSLTPEVRHIYAAGGGLLAWYIEDVRTNSFMWTLCCVYHLQSALIYKWSGERLGIYPFIIKKLTSPLMPFTNFSFCLN